ncbi:putative mannose-1-phosphate guanylyltransferase/mannose-6-phosphate isomerase [Candidatus Nitrososphaera gargensis Ga9.2]|uniref:Putative mannose-1-phosphate guanylyltransferase/mannose-6-phosphate isomerase n=1 Tax=Nitrososphaera gargensis (strain Ga9.2) TaxID=1237085 RepID=K0IM17_NITGG|nr:phosphomannose isomerase type II C-terminal cupin domain [Candidatus Nitrososphaera gargensis]AFU59892.1 putative mannose-1-phosphate guanylyltransferase/mannose-6-phosphate isomerase [Candidatus Nitrososphaera gargensis Ga9.2]
MNIYSESRPWGRFEKFHENKPCTVKLIYVNANSRLSLQYHNKRSEFWKVIKGTAMVELNDRNTVLKEGETISIPKQARHRVSALDSECVILEIAYGKFDENDIVRIEDDYNRAAMPAKTRVATA